MLLPLLSLVHTHREERGACYAIDIGGTNFRVVYYKLSDKRGLIVRLLFELRAHARAPDGSRQTTRGMHAWSSCKAGIDQCPASGTRLPLSILPLSPPRRSKS